MANVALSNRLKVKKMKEKIDKVDKATSSLQLNKHMIQYPCMLCDFNGLGKSDLYMHSIREHKKTR